MKVKMLKCVQAGGRILDAGAVVCVGDVLAARLIASGRAESEDAFAVESVPDAVPVLDEAPKKKRPKK